MLGKSGKFSSIANNMPSVAPAGAVRSAATPHDDGVDRDVPVVQRDGASGIRAADVQIPLVIAARCGSDQQRPKTGDERAHPRSLGATG
jgi:hypothetical protein